MAGWRFFDGLMNLVSGAGTTADKRVAGRYLHRYVDPTEIEAAYRTSWMMRKGIDLPPFDMTRGRRDWQAKENAVDKIEAEEKRLCLWAKLNEALVLGRLGGGLIVMGVGGDDPSTPLDPARVRGQGLTYIHVLNRHQVSLGQQIMDPVDPMFGEPAYFELNGTGRVVRIHPTRVVPFKGKKVPSLRGAAGDDWYWGDSEFVNVIDAVKNAEAAMNGFASLIEEAKLDTVTIPNLTQTLATAEGEALVLKRVSVANAIKSTHNTRILDGGRGKDSPGETWETRQITWNGMPDMIRTYAAAVAGAFDIPATRFLGKSPDGMNATGAGDEANYHDKIAADQEAALRPALDRIDPVLLRSAGVEPSPEVNYSFPPLSKLSEADRADVFAKRMQGVVALQGTGSIPEPAFSKAVQHTAVDEGWLEGLDGALAEMPEDERFPSSIAANENDEEGGDPTSAPAAGEAPLARRLAANDAAPRTLYVRRDLLNAGELIAWARDAGFTTTLPADDMHVTIAYSRTPIDWMKVASDDWGSDDDGGLIVRAGGVRLIERLGDMGKAVVLMFGSSRLAYRHEEIGRAGASWDHDEYQPHVTLTYDAPEELDLTAIEPFRGALRFGPEIFETINEDWQASLVEDSEDEQRHPFGDAYNPQQPRDENGRWSATSGFAQHVKRALASGKEHSRTEIGKVSEANAEHVKAATSVDISGHTRVAESSDIRHVFNSHGDPAKEEARNQVAVTKASLREVPNIIENAHTIRAIGEKGAKKHQRLEYVATINGHEHHYVEEVRSANTIVALKSMLIKK